MRKITFCILCLTLSSLSVLSQEEGSDKPAPAFSIFLNQDNAFGLYPQVTGSFPINEKLSASFYSIFWNNATFGSPESGSDLWTEIGIGLSFNALNDQMIINPSIGFTHGKLLSGGPQGVPFEGIVPNVVGLIFSGNFECELFATYYKSIRNEGPETSDFLLYWTYPGFIISDYISVGAHYEGFALTRSTSGISEMLYHWLGAYIKFNISESHTLRFSAGTNMKEGAYSDGFYKMTMYANLF